MTLPKYQFEAANRDGRLERGQITAPTQSAAVSQLREQGRTPVSVIETTSTGLNAGSFRQLIPTIPSYGAGADRLAIFRELSTLLNAGVGVDRALALLSQISVRPRVKSALEIWSKGLRAGRSLSNAMAQTPELIPETMGQLIAAGEASGQLPQVVSRVAKSLADGKRLRDAAISSLIYPAILTIVMLAVLTLMFTVVIPQLEPLFDEAGTGMPWTTAMMVAVSHFLNAFWIWLLIALVGGLWAIAYSVRQPKTRYALDAFVWRTRIFLGLPKKYETAQFARNLGMLLEGGLALNRALEAATKAVSNRFLRQELIATMAAVRHGQSLKSGLAKIHGISILLVELVGVGEQTGRLGPMLTEVSDILDVEVKTTLDRLSALLLPAVTIILGLVVAAIMAGVVTGILAANDLAL